MSSDPGYADQARHQAQQILSRSPYSHPASSTPRPLAGLLHAVGHGLDVVFGPIGRWLKHTVFRPVGSGLHSLFGAWTLGVLVVVAVGFGVLAAALLVRRRSRIAARPVDRLHAATRVDPSAIEEEADRLAAAGDFASAVRLRFQAGLLRLEGAGLVAHQEVQTASQMSGLLGSPTFDRLAERHQAVTYAGMVAGAEDVQSARAGWPQVSDEVERHRTLTEAGQR
jgi:hypothetical protein